MISRRKCFRTLVIIRHLISKKGEFFSFLPVLTAFAEVCLGFLFCSKYLSFLLPSVPVFLLFLLKKVPTLCTVPARGGLPAGGGGPQASEPPEGRTIVRGGWGRIVATT